MNVQSNSWHGPIKRTLIEIKDFNWIKLDFGAVQMHVNAKWTLKKRKRRKWTNVQGILGKYNRKGTCLSSASKRNSSHCWAAFVWHIIQRQKSNPATVKIWQCSIFWLSSEVCMWFTSLFLVVAPTQAKAVFPISLVHLTQYSDKVNSKCNKCNNFGQSPPDYWV